MNVHFIVCTLYMYVSSVYLISVYPVYKLLNINKIYFVILSVPNWINNSLKKKNGRLLFAI